MRKVAVNSEILSRIQEFGLSKLGVYCLQSQSLLTANPERAYCNLPSLYLCLIFCTIIRFLPTPTSDFSKVLCLKEFWFPNTYLNTYLNI